MYSLNFSNLYGYFASSLNNVFRSLFIIHNYAIELHHFSVKYIDAKQDHVCNIQQYAAILFYLWSKLFQIQKLNARLYQRSTGQRSTKYMSGNLNSFSRLTTRQRWVITTWYTFGDVTTRYSWRTLATHYNTEMTERRGERSHSFYQNCNNMIEMTFITWFQYSLVFS